MLLRLPRCPSSSSRPSQPVWRGSTGTYLKVPPRLRLLAPECVCDADELVHRHLGQAIVVHNSTAPRLSAVGDVAARGLCLVVTVDTVAQVDVGVLTKGRQDLCRGCGVAAGERRDEMGVERVRRCC